jgi:hypothetical protein
MNVLFFTLFSPSCAAAAVAEKEREMEGGSRDRKLKVNYENQFGKVKAREKEARSEYTHVFNTLMLHLET